MSRKKIFYSLGIILLFSLTSKAQIIHNFKIQDWNPDRNALVGNGITDLVWSVGKLYAGTGYGLSSEAAGSLLHRLRVPVRRFQAVPADNAIPLQHKRRKFNLSRFRRLA